MGDVLLMSRLLRALPPNASLLLAGDVDQLPSVGPGMVLGNLIDSGVVLVVRLTEVFRQGAHSRVITTTHRINEGLMPETPAREAESDFYFIDRAEPEQISATVLDMVKKRIPARFGLDPLRDIQVLCPMNRGSLGIRELNVKLQGELNPARQEETVVEKFGWQFRVRDKVIQTENNYDKDVFNGDIGQIAKIDPLEREVTVRFDQREVVYDFGELDEVALAYAITIHKSPGVRISGCRHSAGDAAIPPAPAESRLHRHHAGQKAGGGRRPAEGAGYCSQEQPHGAAVFRFAGPAPGSSLTRITRGVVKAQRGGRLGVCPARAGPRHRAGR